MKKMIEVKKLVKEWKIWDKEGKAVKSEEKAKKLVPVQFHKSICVFDKKTSESMPTKKTWDYIIDLKKRFMLRKGKVYPLSWDKREEVRNLI